MWTRKKVDTREVGSGTGFSFYHDFIGGLCASGPDEASTGPLHRISTLARKMRVRRLVYEDVSERADIIEELDGLERILGGDGEVRATKITFLSARDPSSAGAVIGQAIVVTFPYRGTQKSYVMEARMRSPSLGSRAGQLLNHDLPFEREQMISVLGMENSIRGSLFCQQNGVTSVCAHSTLKTVVNGLTGATPTTAGLNDAWGTASFLTGEGIGAKQIASVFEGLGRGFRHIDFATAPSDVKPSRRAEDILLRDGTASAQAWQLMAAQVASGQPVIMALPVPGQSMHVVPVVGASMNTDEWHPNAVRVYGGRSPAALSSALWIDHLTVHDDLQGPYLALSRGALEPGSSGLGFSMRPTSVIVSSPGEVDISATTAEAKASEKLEEYVRMLREVDIGRGRWWDFVSTGNPSWVLRTVLMSRDDYVSHLRSTRRKGMDSFLAEVGERFLSNVPERFWMCEISLPQLFAGTKLKLGEILVEPRFSDDGYGCAIRLPSVVLWREPNRSLVAASAPAFTVPTPIFDPRRNGNSW